MVDAAIDMQKDLFPSKSTDSLIALKSDVTSEYERLSSSPELHYISSNDKDESKESEKTPTDSELNTILTYAKFMFEAGQYEESCKALTFYTENSNASDLSSSFGLLSSQILSGESSAAIKTIQQIRQAIEESESSSPLFKLQNRTWLIHWAMHAFFQLEDPATHIVDFFFATQQRETESGRVIRSRDYEYLKVLQASCPWILRYVAAAVVIKKYRRNINHLVYIIKEERSKYTDPILRTLLALYDDYDLDQAQAELSQFDDVSKADYFFSFSKNFSDQFKKSARQLIFRTYCLTHREIDMKALASKLEMELSECEKWTVDLIQTEGTKKLNDAKIDTENGVAVMDVRYPSIYERIINKTRDLTMRSYDMAGTMSQM